MTNLPDRLSAEDLVARAEFHHRRGNMWMTLAVICAAFLIVLWLPVHTWLHVHLEFLAGILVGSLLQIPIWARDRWRWFRWFSWQ